MRRAPVQVLSLLALALVLAATGCVRGCRSSRPPIHLNPNMDSQPRYDPQEASRFFYDGMAMRVPPEGTVARGELREDDEFYTGKSADGEFLTEIPPLTEAQLARGPERYRIYCQPCHDSRGRGRGVLFEYGGVPTASFFDEQRMAYPAGRIFDVATNGSGLMKGYRWPVPAADRWSIVAHVQELQRRHGGAALASAAAGQGDR